MSVIGVDQVSKSFSTHKALDQVSLSVPEGKIYGLLGPNGAGKTTLIRIINQITFPDSGSVSFKGEPLAPIHVEKIGYMPEERGLYKKMQVGDQLRYLGKLKGMKADRLKEKIKFWVERLEIKDWWTKKVEDLSKGMQQKIQFIATVLHEPELLILDEPFSGFDPVNASIIKDEILKMKENGTTILFSTHRMESVEELCDHIALLNKSKKVLDGDKNAIKEQFRDKTYTVETRFPLENHVFDVVKTEPIGSGYRSKIAALDPVALFAQISAHNQITAFYENLPTMEEIFFKAVNYHE
jgi:ABC-2 type transport system ATP-binding protein